MSEGLFANRSPAATSVTDAERVRGQASARPFAMAGPEAVRMLLGLQRAAGNASVVQLLQRRAMPTALRACALAADADELAVWFDSTVFDATADDPAWRSAWLARRAALEAFFADRSQ